MSSGSKITLLPSLDAAEAFSALVHEAAHAGQSYIGSPPLAVHTGLSFKGATI
jgi:hypothetical protein